MMIGAPSRRGRARWHLELSWHGMLTQSTSAPNVDTVTITGAGDAGEKEGVMSPTATIIVLWIGFAGSHLALSSLGIRQRIVERINEGPFRGLYSLVAFAFFIPLVWTYFTHKHAGSWLWVVPH